MKSVFLYIFTTLLLIQTVLCISKDLDEMSLDCIKQVDIDSQVIEEAKKGNIPENNDKYKDYLACYYKKQNFQTENGTIILDNIKEMLSEFYTMQQLEIINPCQNLPGKTHGEKAFKTLNCVLEKMYKLES